MGSVVEMSEAAPKSKTPEGWHKFWQKEYDAATRRLRKFQKQGNQVSRRYLDERAGAEGDTSGEANSSLNLFHSNVSTLEKMLYGQTPKIDVTREHQDPDDDVARVAATLYKRMLSADVTPSGEDLPTLLRSALQDRLLPGLGTTRVRYDVETQMTKVFNPETGGMDEVEQMVSEEAPIDYIHWQDNLWGWGRNWKELPWWGFRSWLNKDEVKARFGAEVAKKLEYKTQQPTGGDKHDETFEADQQNNIKKAEIWEFWQKSDKKVYWWCQGADLILDIQDDPLKLEGFLPMPRPMTANMTTTLYVPKADFVLAQDLYNEIDELQTRISIITRAIKVVGVYDQSAGASVGRMLGEGNENDLIPVENWAMFAEKGGLKGTIDWFPVDQVVGVLQTLAQIQEGKISQLHQITGMSDILRGGDTQQYTSDGTNQLKAKFGSVKVQALQDEFARFAGDLEALKAEVISKHFSPQTILKQSSAQFMPEADKDKIQPALALMQSPDIKWRVNIRPESMSMLDYAALKAERTEYLTAMATFLQSANSMVKVVPESMPMLLEFMKFGLAGFKGSDYLEGILDKTIELAKKTPPKGQDDGKQEAEKAKADAEMQKLQAKLQGDMQVIQAKSQAELSKIQADHQANMREQMAKDQGDTRKIMADLQADLKIIATKLNADLTVEQAQSQFAIAERDVEHTNNMTEESQQHSNKLAESRKNAQMASDNESSDREE